MSFCTQKKKEKVMSCFRKLSGRTLTNKLKIIIEQVKCLCHYINSNKSLATINWFVILRLLKSFDKKYL
jgi:hypothetical protein